jgi:DNA phosphorothioation-associated putative methyltransferase
MNNPANIKPAFKGKIIGGFMYAHKSALPFLSEDLTKSLNNALQLLRDFKHWNVIKFSLKDVEKLSFLEYESFEETEFPCLIHSCQVDLNLQTIKIRKHSTSNPPVLHRKELLMRPDHPELTKFQSLTLQLENLGAFKNIVKLGTKLRWQDELDGLNIVIKGHVVTKTGRPNNVG